MWGRSFRSITISLISIGVSKDSGFSVHGIEGLGWTGVVIVVVGDANFI